MSFICATNNFWEYVRYYVKQLGLSDKEANDWSLANSRRGS